MSAVFIPLSLQSTVQRPFRCRRIWQAQVFKHAFGLACWLIMPRESIKIVLRRNDQPLFDPSCEGTLGATFGTGSNNENNKRPAKNPPICACQATLAPSAPIAIDPTPKTILTPNQMAQKPSTRL